MLGGVPPLEAVLTAEARWFVAGPLPADAAAWAVGLGADPAPESRVDRYLVPAGPDGPGVKMRGGRLQVKQRSGVSGPARWGRVEGVVETWRKWSLPLSTRAVPAEWPAVRKRRLRAAFAHLAGRPEPGPGVAAEPAGVCVEVAALEVEGRAWWSVCLEAWGPDEAARLAALRAVGGDVFGPGAPALRVEDAAGYPAWIHTVLSRPN